MIPDTTAAPVRPFRSALYIPGSRPRAMEKAAGLDCDAIIFDLEDAVAPDAKAEARAWPGWVHGPCASKRSSVLFSRFCRRGPDHKFFRWRAKRSGSLLRPPPRQRAALLHMVDPLIQQFVGHGQLADLGVEPDHFGVFFARPAGELLRAARHKSFAPLGQLGGADLKLAAQGV